MMNDDNNSNNEMAAKAEQKLHMILTTPNAPKPRSDEYRNWFLSQFATNDNGDDWCSLESFAVYFLNAIRQRTYCHLRTNDQNDAVEESQPITPLKSLKSIIDNENANNSPDRRKGTTTTITTFPALATPVKFGHVSNRNASTPVRKGGLNIQQQQTQHTQYSHHSQQQNQRRSGDNVGRNFSTPNNSSFEKSRNSTGDSSTMGSSSFCLGDFMSFPTTNSRHLNFQKKKANLNTSATTPGSSGGNNKPKKRVVPISVSKTTTLSFNDSSPFGINSSFSGDNNILTISQTEIGISNKRAIAEARKALKNDLTEVSSVLKATTPTSTPTKTCISSTEISTPTKQIQEVTSLKNFSTGDLGNECIDFNELSNETLVVLQQLATIYVLLLDMNFVLNILNEISFLLNLINANLNSTTVRTTAQKELLNPNISNNSIEILTEAINSIYFGMCVLEDHEETLAMIDMKSLGVVLQCERLISTSENLKSSLTTVYEQKQALSITSASDTFFSGLKNVCFQEESDSRKFFPSTFEFSAFKTQRDLFYTALKLWEKHHLHPSWNFAIEIAPKIREILRQSENPVNMTHFAKLFVSQLLVSANEQTSPEDIGIGNDDVDLQKFNKLTQRLIAPSNFSVDYQFPREQAFFRDFIVESRSVPFIEHLKMVLYSQLITLNDSTFEQLNLLNEESGDREEQEDSEFIVRPSVLSSMIILAKFLGFVTALPFHCAISCEANFALIQSYQQRLRNLFQPPIDISEILDMALINRRHLITVPWLVQYMVMLDEVTLQLQHFVKTIEKFFALYMSLGNGQVQLLPISQFVLRCCIGWLFEQKPFIAAEYYIYRATHNVVLINRSPKFKSMSMEIKPMLESVLCVACPFLADFRVSIMPAKYALTKYVSRSGRYRHITPCLAEFPKITENSATTAKEESNAKLDESAKPSTAKKRQKKLMESFLHAQNSSMRRLIIFLTERVYKCVVKEAQYKILIPSKSTADSCVNDITSCDRKEVYSQVNGIYQNARNEALKQWDLQVPEMINDRTRQGLEALLPSETVPIIKQTYAWRIKSDASARIQHWRHMNLFKSNFYCHDPLELTEKLCKSNINRTKQTTNQTTEMKLIKSDPSISDLIEEIQHWLYTTESMTNFRPEQCPIHLKQKESSTDACLIDFLRRLTSSFENTLPTIYYRLIGAGLVQLLQQLITSTPQYMTQELIKAVCEFFANEKIRVADIATTPFKTLNSYTNLSANESSNTPIQIASEATTIYHALITAPFIESLGNCQQRYEKLKNLLTSMIQHGVITLDFVNELFVAIFKEDLRACVFNEISKLLHELAQEINKGIAIGIPTNESADNDSEDGRKSRLFMEVLADLSRDLDEF